MPRFSDCTWYRSGDVQFSAMADPQRVGNKSVVLLNPLLDVHISNRFGEGGSHASILRWLSPQYNENHDHGVLDHRGSCK